MNTGSVLFIDENGKGKFFLQNSTFFDFSLDIHFNSM